MFAGSIPALGTYPIRDRQTRLGRQLADHLGLEPGMLWVRIPSELIDDLLRPRGAAECSPACHAGDRRFKSGRGRCGGRVGAVRKLAKRLSSNLGVCGFDSLLRYESDRSRRLGIGEPNCL